MRVTVLLFILLLTNDLMGQRILLFDKENNTAVVNVNISNNIKGTTSDVNGFADLNVFDRDDERTDGERELADIVLGPQYSCSSHARGVC